MQNEITMQNIFSVMQKLERYKHLRSRIKKICKFQNILFLDLEMTKKQPFFRVY